MTVKSELANLEKKSYNMSFESSKHELFGARKAKEMATLQDCHAHLTEKTESDRGSLVMQPYP